MTPVCPFFVCRVLRFLRGSRTPIIMRTKKRVQLLLGPRVRKQPQTTPEVISSCVYYQMILQALQCDKHCGTTTLDRDIHVDSSYCIGTAATNITHAFTPITFTPNATYAEQLLHQTALTADTFYTKTDLTQTASHQTVPNSFYTRRIVLYTKSFLHQTDPDILRTPMYLLPGNVIVFHCFSVSSQNIHYHPFAIIYRSTIESSGCNYFNRISNLSTIITLHLWSPASPLVATNDEIDTKHVALSLD